jgi:hypothetical protein
MTQHMTPDVVPNNGRRCSIHAHNASNERSVRFWNAPAGDKGVHGVAGSHVTTTARCELATRRTSSECVESRQPWPQVRSQTRTQTHARTRTHTHTQDPHHTCSGMAFRPACQITLARAWERARWRCSAAGTGSVVEPLITPPHAATVTRVVPMTVPTPRTHSAIVVASPMSNIRCFSTKAWTGARIPHGPPLR